MTPQELKELRQKLLQQRRNATKSPKAARAFLRQFGMLTASGKLKKSFNSATGISR